MNSFVMFAVFALAAVANCEAPGGYNYNAPSSRGGFASGGNFGGNGGGGYQQEAVSGNTNEGINVDPQLLNLVKQVILSEEQKSGAGSGASAGGFGGAPSTSYGVPQSSYGPPAQQGGRVVGIILENPNPAIQVAQYRQQSQSASGYPSGPASFGGSAPSINAPSSSYGAPQRPSSNYGAPSY